MPEKILVIRFSSFGDIMQCLPAVGALRMRNEQAHVHFATRTDFVEVVQAYRISQDQTSAPQAPINCVWALDRKSGVRGLFRLILDLRRERYTHIYDAHSNLRSFLITSALRLSCKFNLARRPKRRIKRLLLFLFRINLFSKPFRGVDSYLEPLHEWLGDPGITSKFHSSFDCSTVTFSTVRQGLPADIDQRVAIVPGAAWPLKEWPKVHWQTLIQSLGSPVLVLGGKDDEICKNLVAPSDAIRNLAGELTWLQCLSIISQVKAIVAGDTGLMHAADLLGRPTVALIGPTAFGFPKQPTSRVLEVPLKCRPCTKDGRGRCRNKVYKACMTGIDPHRVTKTIHEVNDHAVI